MRNKIFALALSFLPSQAVSCDLALALAVDISGSVDPQEFQVQMQGLADALREGVVSEALVRAEAAVMLVQWTGSSRQDVSIPWTRITTYRDAEAFAERIETTPRRWRNFSTAIGEALSFTMSHWGEAPLCKRNIIDISGDGPSNEGAVPRDVHAQLRAANITVNALAIEESEADLTAYFYEHVIRGEGAFVVTANRFSDYPDRIRMKLIRETTAQLSCSADCTNHMRLKDEG